MGARRQPLIFIITTAGFDKSSVCFSEYEYAKQVLQGSLNNDEYFTIIYEPDDINDIWVFMSEYKEKLNKNEDVSKQEELINKIIFQANPIFTSFFSFLERRYPFMKNPFRGTKTRPPVKNKKRLEVPTKKEIELIIKDIADPLIKVAIIYIYYRINIK
ncbi:hypothetical protein BFL38_00600 [Brachyspira hampsonii]|uniref:Uncharacterized protein n=1 Tax=Brachyspira hampsonii TaxID=1287055 RepID=A0A1E5NAA8_9SPIR|nr:hypothetical protein BFL38_00600 [Brachyspira hampsonii]